MKVYDMKGVNGKTVYRIQGWSKDERSFQVNGTVVFVIGEIYTYIHKDWKNLVMDVENDFVNFLNDGRFERVDSVKDLEEYIQQEIEDGNIEYLKEKDFN